MRKIAFVITIFLLGAMMVQAQETERPKFMVHYMPWYQTPSVSGYWGWHWTMDFFNPDQLDENARPEIASHYTPLTGAYDSQDEDVLEYQVLLMHLSGIDGVIVDWYGIDDFRDYHVNNLGTLALFEQSNRAKLEFALAYEDATIEFMVDGGYIDQNEANAHANETMQFANEHWFTDEHYLRFNEQALLFVFGPQYFRSPDAWATIFEGIEPTPALVTLDGHMDWAALSSYLWLPMNLAGGAELVQPVLEVYLDRFYENMRRDERELNVGSAFPGFHDIYSEAGVRSSYGYLNAQDGATFQYTLDTALANDLDIIQLVTWNDYGEGTMIEPTEEYGYQYLEMLQDTRRFLDSDFAFTGDDLRLPLQIYELRKAHPDDEAINATLDDIFNAIIDGDLASARELLSSL